MSERKKGTRKKVTKPREKFYFDADKKKIVVNSLEVRRAIYKVLGAALKKDPALRAKKDKREKGKRPHVGFKAEAPKGWSVKIKAPKKKRGGGPPGGTVSGDQMCPC